MGAMMEASIRRAQGKADVGLIYDFVSVVSKPVRLCNIDKPKSIAEINRVVNDDKYGFAFIAEINNEIVGSIGIICPEWWYGNGVFFTDRWMFVFPALKNTGIGAALIVECAAVAEKAEIDLLINGKPVRRNKTCGRGIFFQSHSLIRPGDIPTEISN